MFSTMGSLHPRMPGTIDNEMALLGNGNMHWVTIRRDASDMSRPAIAALLKRRASPGKKTEEDEEEKKKKNKKKKWLSFSFSFGWLAGPPPSANESTDTPPPPGGEAASQLSQGFQVIRGARMAKLCDTASYGNDAGTEKSETRKGKLLSMVPRAWNFIRRKCGARRKAPPSSGGESVGDDQRATHGEEQAGPVQGSQGQIPTVYPLSGGKLTMTDWQLNQAKDNMGLPTPARSEATLVDGRVGGSSASRYPVFPEAWWVYRG